MSKRNSRVPHYALVNAVHNVVKNNATFKIYYDAKGAESQSHYNAFGHCAGKIVMGIRKTLTDEVEFNPEYEVCIPTSIEFEKHLLGNLLKLPFFTTNTQNGGLLIYT